MSGGSTAPRPAWPVGAVATRLDIAPSTLRTWDRRYGVGPSDRTGGGHRRYTEEDIQRVELVRRLVSRGMAAKTAADVARSLDDEQLDAALGEPSGRDPDALDEEDLVDAILAATVTEDAHRLHRLYTGLLARHDVRRTWRSVLSPAMVRIACERSNGVLSPKAERIGIAELVDTVHDRTPVAGDPVAGDPAAGDPAAVRLALVHDGVAAGSLPLLAIELILSDGGVPTALIDVTAEPDSWLRRLGRLHPDITLLWDLPEVDHDGVEVHGGVVATARCAWPHEVELHLQNVITTGDAVLAAERLARLLR